MRGVSGLKVFCAAARASCSNWLTRDGLVGRVLLLVLVAPPRRGESWPIAREEADGAEGGATSGRIEPEDVCCCSRLAVDVVLRGMALLQNLI